MWSALSIIALLGGIGLLLTYFGRYSSFLGWHVEENRRVRFRAPSEISLTPAQRATAWYFVVVAALFLVQTLLGGATAHYHAETGGFFGYDLARVLPYNLARTWHLQLALFWVVASFLAAGIFLAPVIAGSEPRGQRLLTVCSPRRPGRCGGGQPRRRSRQLQGNARRQRASVPRRARLGVSRSRTFMAVAADRGIGCSGA